MRTQAAKAGKTLETQDLPEEKELWKEKNRREELKETGETVRAIKKGTNTESWKQHMAHMDIIQ